MMDFAWGEAQTFWGWGSWIWHVATFGGEHMAKGINWGYPNWVGLWGGVEAPALLGCRVKLVLRCYVKLNFYLTLNYVSQLKKVYIH